jgi:uncharacterized protein
MVMLKADPWDPASGAGAEAPFEDEDAPVVDPEVETSRWSEPIRPGPAAPEPVTFVDGVMRIDLRVLAYDGGRRGWGLLGSFAAGGVTCDGSARFVGEDEPVGRTLILGGRLAADPLVLDAGGCRLAYEPRSLADDSPTTQRRVLQRLMLEAEQRMAVRLAEDTLVFADGPLHINAAADLAIVGVVKRMVTAYLQGEHAALLHRLEPGERSPVFALGNTVLDRYAWYQRLVPLDPTWHELAALVRCEVRMELGLERARAIAGRTAYLLPRFASRPGIEPRAPQNLTPVGALEGRLRHRLGNATVVRRALRVRLAEELHDE